MVDNTAASSSSPAAPPPPSPPPLLPPPTSPHADADAGAMAADTPAAPSIDPAPILQLLNGFRASQVLFTLVSLGVPDMLSPGDGIKHTLVQLDELLSRIAARQQAAPSRDGLARLLDAAVGLGLLRGSNAQGYGLTPASSSYLRKDAACSLAGYVQHSSDVLYPLWGQLGAAVHSGSNVWRQVFGRDSADVFASLYADEAAVLRFMRGMHGFSSLSAQRVLTAFDLSSYSRLVDLGGASGAMAAAACAAHPQMAAVVVDLPHVVAVSQQHFGRQADMQALGPRLSWVAGDMFAPHAAQQLPRGDLVLLSRILHDYDDDRCRQLLCTVFELLPAGGAVLVAEMLLEEDGTGPCDVLLQSLNMLAQTHGRERRLSEFAALLEAAGFARVAGKRTGAYLDAIIAYKGPPE